MRSLPLRAGLAALCVLFAFGTGVAGEVAIYTGATSWIDKALADEQAQVCADKLTAWGVNVTVFSSAADDLAVAEWVSDNTGDGDVDALILYGWVPSSIYGAGNSQPDGSIAEAFIESTDGDAILNHADYMFYVSSTNNAEGGLQNLMDIGGITMWDDNTPVTVTPQGKAIAPSLSQFLTDRPFHLNELAGDWFVEASLAENAAGTRADPAIVRDGDRGRLIIAYQTAVQNDPKGAVAAEIIAWLFEVDLQPAALGLVYKTGDLAGEGVQLAVQLLESTGGPVAAKAPVTVNLGTSSATGRFDTAISGRFDGTVTSLTIPAGESTVQFYYKDPTAGTPTVTANAAGLTGATLAVKIRARKPMGEVAIYTGNVNWITKALADAQAQICVNKLNLLGIPNVWYSNAAQKADLASWVVDATGNDKVDVLVLYGYFPETIYPPGNTQPDDSIAELFIESTDGDAILNHADYMFYVSSAINDVFGLQNMMDIPGISMWDDDTPMTVTPEGRWIAPSLTDYLTDRPFHVDELAGEWFVEAALAQDFSGRRADPIIVRDGDRGRLIPCFQAADQVDPKGAVAAETIAWLLGVERGGPDRVAILGRSAGFAGQPLKLTVQIQDATGSPSAVPMPMTVNLAAGSLTAAFDLTADGPFDRTVRSVTIPAGEASADVYYKDNNPGTRTLSASAAGLTAGTLDLSLFARTFATPGEVVIYTGRVNWIDKAAADVQAQICVDRLLDAGIAVIWYQSPEDEVWLADWVSASTGNDQLDVLVLYGYFPPSLYAAANAQPDGSVAEAFIESTDGDAILNHADYMFYVSADAVGNRVDNGEAGLQNMMDVPGITMWDDDTALTVTADGRSIAPSLNDFLSDRPLHLDQLGGNWLVEAALAVNATGTRADPVIVRDGDRGRLIPVFQTNTQNDPKGAVAAEIIAWLMRTQLEPTKLALLGAPTMVTGTPVKFWVGLADSTGTLTASSQPITVKLSTDSATGAFETVWDGPYAGTVTSITIPAGKIYGTFYYKEARAGTVTLSVSSSDPGALDPAELSVEVLQDSTVEFGQVAIYTGNVNWIDKVPADAQAQICVDSLSAAGVSSVWFASDADKDDLASWVADATGNGRLDVLVLYGYFPETIYSAENAQPDDSLAELFIESEDGDMILNHADYMFYVSSTNNDVAGLQNMMDNPAITMWGDNTPMTVTREGTVIAPSLSDYVTDRPFHIDELAGDWFVEASLAEDATGLRADPIIVRDGTRGRLAPVYQASFQDDPKGAVAAEIIIWLRNKVTGGGEPIFRRGDANADGAINITDGVYVLNHLFLGGPEPPCKEAADPNDDGGLNITDGIYILNFLFLGGFAPTAPGPDVCGPDPSTSAHLGCASYTNC